MQISCLKLKNSQDWSNHSGKRRGMSKVPRDKISLKMIPEYTLWILVMKGLL